MPISKTKYRTTHRTHSLLLLGALTKVLIILAAENSDSNMSTQGIHSTCRKSLSMRGSSAASTTVFLLALLSWPHRASSFSSPQAIKRGPPTITRHSSSSSITRLSLQRNDGNDNTLNSRLQQLDTSRMANGTDWSNSQLPAHTTSFVEIEATATATAMTPSLFLDEGSTLLEQELLEGYIAHQAYLNLLDRQQLEQQSEVVTEPSNIEQDTVITQEPSSIATTPSTTTDSSTPSIPVLSDVWKARLLLLLSAALYGTNFTMVKSLDESMSVGMSSTLRFGFAAVAMLPWLFAPLDDELKNATVDADDGELAKEGPSRFSVGLVGMEIGMYAAVGYIAQAVGLKTTTASKSAFICSMAVVIVPILDYIWGKQLLRRQIIGAALASAGVYALEIGGGQTFCQGDLLSMVQPLMFGLGFWRMEAAMEKYPTEAGRLAAAQLLMVFIISFSYLMYSTSPMGDPNSLNPIPSTSEIMACLQDPNILGMLFWTGIVTTAFTIYMETLALKTLSAAETTLIFSTEPIFGAAFAAVVAGESLGMDSLVGAAFIILGCVVSGIDVETLFGEDDKVVDVEVTVANE